MKNTALFLILAFFLTSCATSAKMEVASDTPKETTYGTMALKGSIEGGDANVRIRLKTRTQGGKEETLGVFKPGYKDASGKYQWSSKVALPSLGSNEIKAEVIGQKGEIISNQVVSVRRRPPAIYAVVIGISQYAHKASLGKARHATRDAMAFSHYLTNHLGISPKRVKLVLDKEANVKNIRHTLGVWFPKQIQKDDMVFVFWAGMGATESLGSNQTTRYFLCHDTTPERLYSKGISWSEIKRILIPKIPARRVVFIADVSFETTGDLAAGSQRAMETHTGGKFIAVEGAERGELEDLLLKADGYGMAFIMPSSLSFDDDNLQHDGTKAKGAGAFTYHLLRGLRGEADGAGGGRADNIVEVTEILSYLHELKGIPANLRPMQELYVNGRMYVGARKRVEE